MRKLQASAVRPQFAVETRVRVKIGVMDPDFPGVHLGDWTGTVFQIENGKLTTYLVQWSPETLERVRSAHQDYCEEHDKAFDRMWLLEEDLERTAGAPPLLKRQKAIARDSRPC